MGDQSWIGFAYGLNIVHLMGSIFHSLMLFDVSRSRDKRVGTGSGDIYLSSSLWPSRLTSESAKGS